VQAVEHGFVIRPVLRRFSLRLPEVGVARGARVLRGYFVVQGSPRVLLEVGGLPAGARDVVAWAGGRSVRFRRQRGLVAFPLATRRGQPADWAVTWR
jgi:hypothetical protein